MTASSATYGPINKTTFGETADGTVIRRMPNLVKFREDPDAMLVMSLEDYDEVTGKAAKAAIMNKDVVGKNPPITASQRRGRVAGFAQSTRRGRSAVYRRTLRQARGQVIAELGDLIFPRPGSQKMADRRRLSVGQRAGQARRRRSCRPALRPQCRGPASSAARRRAARRHRRQSRGTVDTGKRHPGIRRRTVPRRSIVDSRSAI